MIILLPLLAKLSIRSRILTGRVLVAIGVLALLVGVAAVPAIVVEAAITVIVGAIFLFSVRWSRRSGRGATPSTFARR